MCCDPLCLAWKEERAAVGAQTAVCAPAGRHTARCTCAHCTDDRVLCGSLKMVWVQGEQLLRIDCAVAWLRRRLLHSPSWRALCVVDLSWTLMSISRRQRAYIGACLLFQDLTTTRHERVVLTFVLYIGFVCGRRRVLSHPNLRHLNVVTQPGLALGHLWLRRQLICIANDVVLYKELCDVRLQSLCVTKCRASKTHA
jgi:hypothetical protein